MSRKLIPANCCCTAPRIVNLGQWRSHLRHRLEHQIASTGDPFLRALADELSAYPGPDAPSDHDPGALVVPLRFAAPGGELAFLSTTTVFGTPMDVTVAELAIETFYPADASTAATLAAGVR